MAFQTCYVAIATGDADIRGDNDDIVTARRAIRPAVTIIERAAVAIARAYDAIAPAYDAIAPAYDAIHFDQASLQRGNHANHRSCSDIYDPDIAIGPARAGKRPACTAFHPADVGNGPCDGAITA